MSTGAKGWVQGRDLPLRNHCETLDAESLPEEQVASSSLSMIDVRYEAELSLARLLPRVEARCAGRLPPPDWAAFRQRLETHFPRLFELLSQLYGTHYDFFYHLENLLVAAAEGWQ